MDPLVQVLIAGIVCSAAAFIVKAIADGAVRMQQLKSGGASPALEERLARIEAAVDAIAIEVERSGELQRFAARLAAAPAAVNAPPVPPLDNAPSVQRRIHRAAHRRAAHRRGCDGHRGG